MNQQRLREIARRGLLTEQEMLRKRLEEVTHDLKELGGSATSRTNGGVVERKRTAPKWSAAKRAEISARMRAYWSKRREESAKMPGKPKAGKRTTG